MEVSYALSYAQATTTWSNLFYLKNMSMLTNKLELRGTPLFSTDSSCK
jgi:hypothetical protein